MEKASTLPLQIISASAGSGKTYQLVYQYIRLLFSSKEKDVFAKIVAMTFTNKAALEMKTRVVQALEILAYPENFKPSENKYIESLVRDLKISREQINQQAKTILKGILHRYEDFMLLTIDKFNLRLIRSFSKDLDIVGDFEVIVDETLLLEKVLDQILSEIGTPNHERLTELALGFSERKLYEDNSWSFQNDLTNRLRSIVSEKNLGKLEVLENTNYSNERFLEIKKAIEKIEKKGEPLIQNLRSIIESQPDEYWIEKLSNGKNTLGALKKIIESPFDKKNRFTNQANTSIHSGSKTKRPIPELSSAVLQLTNYIEANESEYTKLSLLGKQHHYFAFMQLISRRIKSTRNTDKILLISEFNDLLSKLIQGTEAPFIYDRLGYRYRHFLLDEFQDTSRMQWLNLVPLVHEFLGNNNLCFIVGDPKQSIYRFKNGLAEQFVTLPAIYNPEKDVSIEQKSHFFQAIGEKKSMQVNWRSAPTIVEFNNRLFKEIQAYLPPNSKEFYEDHFQICKTNKQGYVRFDMHSKDSGTNYQIDVNWVLSVIDECLQDGFSLGDITILGSKNKECNAWAEILSQNGLKVVSVDSLKVDSNMDVKLIISYFKLRLQSYSALAMKKLISQYTKTKDLNISVYQQYVFKSEGKKVVRFTEFLNENIAQPEMFFQAFESLYDLGVKSCQIFDLDPLSNHYLHHFMNLLFEFELKNGPDLQAFIQYYDLKGASSAVQIPSSQDSIEVMTVHKSKGLEFPVVIMPKVEYRNDTNNQEWHLSENELIEVNIGVSEENVQLNELIEINNYELSQKVMDDINMLYVGFTRPEYRLYGRTLLPLDSKASKNIPSMSVLINQAFPPENGEDNLTRSRFELGERAPKTPSENHHDQTATAFKPVSQKDLIWFPKIALKESDTLPETDEISSFQAYGVQFHQLLASVEKKDELESTLDRFIFDGTIDLVFKEQMLKQGNQIMSEILEPLYQGAEKILSEKNILLPETHDTVRPDKIIIKGSEALVLDFKTGEPNKKHHKQVAQYAQLISEMGYQVKTGIVYTETCSVVSN